MSVSIAVAVLVFAATVPDTAAERNRYELGNHQKQQETIPETNVTLIYC